ncbi:uncharacterized mitochondrial protein AtMg00810-like [Carya illinoinensis]|uniref:uncharacterized mitochondrial protein AtMg00810-like n=1 Tax=Carya illinoinensis TaxID=32201 RepID=UPI001C7232EF|nr:uncharacterized mitochondrial protein AtMg00810-like [Carya illinoinensis]
MTIYFLVYVDDVVLTGSNPHALDQLISLLSVDIHLKDLGNLHYFLGIEYHRGSTGLVLSQRKYILDLLKKTNMTNCKPVSTPISSSTKLFAFDSTSMEDPSLYRSVVGSLQYLLFSRPDLAFSVNQVCLFMHAPRVSHWQAMKCILRFLEQTLNYGLLITPSPSPQLAAFSDTDWAGCPDDRKSTVGYCAFYGKNLICWSSKKQSTLARTSTKAEYKALVHATCELI